MQVTESMRPMLLKGELDEVTFACGRFQVVTDQSLQHLI